VFKVCYVDARCANNFLADFTLVGTWRMENIMNWQFTLAWTVIIVLVLAIVNADHGGHWDV